VALHKVLALFDVSFAEDTAVLPETWVKFVLVASVESFEKLDGCLLELLCLC